MEQWSLCPKCKEMVEASEECCGVSLVPINLSDVDDFYEFMEDIHQDKTFFNQDIVFC